MSTRRARVHEAALVVAGSLAAAVAFTWPLALHLQSRARDLLAVVCGGFDWSGTDTAVSVGTERFDGSKFVGFACAASVACDLRSPATHGFAND